MWVPRPMLRSYLYASKYDPIVFLGHIWKTSQVVFRSLGALTWVHLWVSVSTGILRMEPPWMPRHNCMCVGELREISHMMRPNLEILKVLICVPSFSLQQDTKGDYQRALLNLCGGEDWTLCRWTRLPCPETCLSSLLSPLPLQK